MASDGEDHDAMVRNFCATSGASEELATQYLEGNNWNMLSACNSYFHDEDERNLETRRQQAAAGTLEPYNGPRTLDGRPAPREDFGSTSRRSAPQQKKGVATLGSLAGGSSHHHGDDDGDDDDYDDDDDNDGRGNLFAGGEKSGLAVQDPNQEGGPRKIISDILAKARANAASADAGSEAGPSSSHFRGTGVTLGGEGAESRSIPDPLGGVQSSAPPQERVLHVWQDGFSIDDGELRRFDDPSNEMDLQMIRSGRAPLHLMNVQHDQAIDVKLHQHDTPYKPQPKKYKPFSGSGHRLGSPVPGAGSGTSTAAHAAPAASSSSAAPTPSIDNSQPTILIRIQMPDGTRLPVRFNTTNTVGDVYGFVQSASVDTQSRPWVLVTTFPNKELTDKGLVLGEMAEFKKGGTAVVKWA